MCVPDPQQRRLRRALPRPERQELRRPARHRSADADIDGGQHGRLRRPGRAARNSAQNNEPDLQPVQRTKSSKQRALHRRHGLPRRARDPELLDVRARTSCCRTTCSSRPPPGACPSTSTWSPAGRRVCPNGDPNPLDCVNSLEPRIAGQDWLRAARPGQSDVRVDRHHLPARQARRELALLRLRRRASPTASDDEAVTCTTGQADAETPGIWNPLPALHRRPAGRPARQHPVAGELLRSGSPNRQLRAAERLLDRPEPEGLRASPRSDRERAGLRHDADQLDHAQPLLGQHRDLPVLG